MDPLVAKIRFAKEAGQEIRDNHQLLRQRGWQVLHCEFPYLVVKLPPSPGGRVRLVKLDLENFDEEAPKWSLVHEAEGFPEVPQSEYPTSGLFLQNHSVTGKIFFCMPGFWDYHTYHGHVQDLWQNHRFTVLNGERVVKSGFKLGSLLMILHDHLNQNGG